MVTTLRNVREIESAASDEELDMAIDTGTFDATAVDDSAVYEGSHPETESASIDSEPDFGDDLATIYFAESGRTPLLKADEERTLACRVEERRYLSRLKQELSNQLGKQPAAIEMLAVILERFLESRSLLEAILKHLGQPAGEMHSMILDQALRKAVDGVLDPELVSAVARGTGDSPENAALGIIKFSLNSRLIPWHLIAEAGRARSMKEFEKAVKPARFNTAIGKHLPEVESHFRRIRERGQRASDHLVQANLRLVISVAKKYMRVGMPLMDLIQEGNMGLLRAVGKFDYRRGYRFSTYAMWWIRQGILRAITCQSRTVRIPVNRVETMMKLTQVKNRLWQEYGRKPTTAELSSASGVPVEKVEDLLTIASSEPISLDTPIGKDDNKSQLGDIIEDHSAVEPEDRAAGNILKEELASVLAVLPQRERRVIELRYGLNDGRSLTLQEIGTELSLSKERARQIERDALRKLRHPSRSRKLIDYLD